MKNVFEYKIEYELDKKSGKVVATIPELNSVSSYGDTFAEAEANVHEAVVGYIEVLQRRGKKVPPTSFKTQGTYLKLLIPQVI